MPTQVQPQTVFSPPSRAREQSASEPDSPNSPPPEDERRGRAETDESRARTETDDWGGGEDDEAELEEMRTALADTHMADVRIATIGNVDSGKSTLVGVLTRAELDDGRGAARSKIFNFSHEQANGRTSSVAQWIMGFDEKGDQVMPGRYGAGAAGRTKEWHHLVEKSNKVVTLLDLCGHERYLKTTVFGLIALCPDYALLVVNANAGFQRMTKEHLGIALALKLPFFICFTKVDLAPQTVIDDNLKMLERIVKSSKVGRIPLIVKSEKDVVTSAKSVGSLALCPVFMVSSVTGEGLDLLRSFVNKLETRHSSSGLFRPPEAPAEMQIDSVYQVPGVGIVVAGTMRSGTIRPNETIMLGPDKSGQWKPVLMKTIHVKRSNVDQSVSGESVSIALRSLVKKDHLKRSTFRRGMALVQGSELSPPGNPVWTFEAEVTVLHHATTIKTRYQAVVHCGVIRQAAQVLWMSSDTLRTGDSARVFFRFMYYAEWVREGEIFLFREGRTRGFGKITRIHAEPPEHFEERKDGKVKDFLKGKGKGKGQDDTRGKGLGKGKAFT